MNTFNTKRTATYADALDSLYPGSVWILRGDSLTNLEWHDSSKAEPTHDILWPEVQRLQSIYDAEEYKLKRKIEYPPLQDLADALYWQSKGDSTKMQAYLAACEAVKQKYPKEA